jgi:hypothetical protein
MDASVLAAVGVVDSIIDRTIDGLEHHLFRKRVSSSDSPLS